MTYPTNWSAVEAGLTLTPLAAGIEAGTPYFEFSVAGTASGQTAYLDFETDTEIAANAGALMRQELSTWLTAGTMTAITDLDLVVRENDVSGAQLGELTTALATPTAAIVRSSQDVTLVEAGTVFARPRLAINAAGSGTIAATFRVGDPSLSLSTPFAFDEEILELERVLTDPPRYRTVVGYARNHTIMKEGDVSGATDAFKDFASTEWRTKQDTDTAVQLMHPSAPEIRIDTALELEAEALAVAQRLNAVFKVRRDVFVVVLRAQPFTLKVGKVVTLTSRRYRLDAGRPFRILSIDEQARRGRITIIVWG